MLINAMNRNKIRKNEEFNNSSKCDDKTHTNLKLFRGVI